MSLSVGQRLGPYEILAPIGEGGMGEVWKARDTRLDRIVAVKVSQDNFSERFEREARAIAALNHPHICTLHDVGPNYLVMELVEGDNLKGPLPIEKAIEYAGQILEALDHAHRKGITHRDLKPANILVTKQGIKLLDFGLAKLKPAPLKETDATLTQALSKPLTRDGQILGTLQYMSPEQLHGKDADARSDLFSFGCVLYEMVTGKRAFDGQSAASVIAAILERPAPSVADVAPQALDRVLKRCLEKDPDKRFQNALDLKSALQSAMLAAGETTSSTAIPARSHSRLGYAGWIAAALLAVAAGTLLWMRYAGPKPVAEQVQFQIPAPENSTIDSFALSPDGRILAFVAGDRLWIRPLDSIEAHPLPGTEGAERPFWSPDSQFVAFDAQSKLKKIAASGGPAQILCDVKAAYGGTWNRDGVIVLPLSFNSGLFRVPASGGTPMPLALDSFGRTTSQIVPEFLPDGRHVLYWTGSGTPALYVGSLDGAPGKRLILDPGKANYVPAADAGGPDGYLVFRRGDTLMAQGFDPNRLNLVGAASPIAEKIAGTSIWPAFHASANGTLVYSQSSGSGAVQLVWRDRAGKQLGLFGPPGTYETFRLSPDEKRVVFANGKSTPDVWVLDSVRGVITRLTFDPAIDDPAMWSPDGLRIVWASNRSGAFDLYIKPANGAGADRLLTKMGTSNGWPEDWSQDGRFLINQLPGAKTGQDLWIAPQSSNNETAAEKPFPYLQSEFDEQHGRFSPDGHWVVYVSNESGRDEIYVQSFPVSGAKFQISAGGGREPQWPKDGKEIFYIAEDRTLMAVPVKLGGPDSFQVGQAKPLFRLSMVSNFIVPRSYAVSNDGQRFLTPEIPGGASAPPLTVVLNWQAGLKK